MNNVKYIIVSVMMIIAVAIIFFLATIFWWPWWAATLLSVAVGSLTLFSNWDKLTVTVPLDTAWVYSFTLRRNKGQISDPVIMWPGENGILLWFHKFEEAISFKRDFSVDAPFVGITSDRARVEGSFKANLRIDNNNIIAWIRNGDSETERENVARENFASAIGQLASSVCRMLDVNTLLSGTVAYPAPSTRVVSGIDFIEEQVICFFERENATERAFGVQMKTITPGNIQGKGDIVKAMDQVSVTSQYSYAINQMVADSSGELTHAQAREVFLLIADEVNGFNLHLGGDPEIVAALAQVTENLSRAIGSINPQVLQRAVQGLTQRGQGGNNTQNQQGGGRSRRRRRGQRGQGGNNQTT